MIINTIEIVDEIIRSARHQAKLLSFIDKIKHYFNDNVCLTAEQINQLSNQYLKHIGEL